MSIDQAPGRPGDTTVPIAVMLIDDHRIFTDALRISLDSQPDLTCVAVAHSAHEGLARAAKVDFAVAVIDLGLPDTTGLELIGGLLSIAPHARVVVLTAHPRPDLSERAVSAGAAAFLGKDATLDQILVAVRTSTPDHPVVGTGVDGGEKVQLTHREHDVLRLLGCGQDASRIAGELGISLHTTRGHIKTVMAKLDAHSQLGAVVAAGQQGLITLGSRY